MSKSLGNVIDSNKACDEMGADIIRLWVASVDTSTDVAIDHGVNLLRTSDAYRRFRNTFRFLLGELEGQFEPEVDGVPFLRPHRPRSAHGRALDAGAGRG